jgi:hypothetical protein
VHKFHAAQITCGDVPSNVSDNAAADGDNYGAAIRSGADQRTGNAFDRNEIFPGFGVVEKNCATRGIAYRFLHRGARVAPDARRTQDEYLRRVNSEAAEFAGRLAQRAATQNAAIRSGGRLDLNAAHG